MRVLVTGFGPFADVADNPSAAVARRLADEPPGGVDVHAETLPVEYDAAAERVAALIEELRPDAVLCLGVARGRGRIDFEALARGGCGGGLDTAGKTPERSRPMGDVRRATVPVEALSRHLDAGGESVGVSTDAGGYVCDHVMYHALRATESAHTLAGFIHLPDPASAIGAGWTLATLTGRVRAALEYLRDG